MFEELNLNRLELQVYFHNSRAIKSYEKVGFKYRSYFKTGFVYEQCIFGWDYYEYVA
ncbi:MULTISPECIES: GNAT family protein [Lysinibacillus]|uniref:GNAT family N-acetyltransferase n=1 Tax=unclassified Lysinibacillus TaxID=2636778 RepID=UPI0022A8A497|nr:MULTISPECIES: GNAT family protein [unclassified Lysinibacillus]MEE3808020.1 GNAT family protein [Lysinibacillus fusiformis]